MKNILLLKNARLLNVLSFALFFFVFGTISSYGQTYYDMSTGNYSQAFTAAGTAYPTNFNGLAAATGTYPSATTFSNATNGSLGVVTTSTALGYDNASSTKMVFLTTGATDNTTALACDLNLNFAGRTAGTLSFDYALILNSAASPGRAASLIIYASADGGSNWTTLTGPYTVYNTTGNSTSAVSITGIALPSSFNNTANCKLRFYEYNGGTVIGTPSGSRPKISLDNIAISSTSSGLTAPTLTAAGGATVDAPFTVTFTDNATWRGAITGVTVGGTALTAGYSVSAGQITFTPSASTPAGLLQSSGTKTISVSATGYSPATVSQAIGAGAANKLAMNTEPAAPATNGGALATQPKVNIVDQYGNATTSTASITAAVGAGSWTLGGTTSVAAVAGTTTFAGLTATSAAAVTAATISFTSSGLTGVTSGTFDIPGPPPANDLCANAQVLTVNATAVPGTMVAATNSANTFTNASANNDVWYKFTPLNTGSHTITLIFTAFSTRDIDFDIFANASCPTTGAVVSGYAANGSNATETVTKTFTFGTTYYIRVLDFNAVNGGAFTIGITGPGAPTITGAATAAAFTTTYGTASASQSFNVSGSGLSGNLVATAPTGFEVSPDGTTYGTTATFTQSGGNASGTLRVRLKANAAVLGSYDSQNIVLSSGATSVNIVTASSGNTVTAKALTITADNRTKAYNTSLTLGTSAFSVTGIANSETVGSVTLSASGAASTATTPVGTYPITATAATGGTFTASNYTITYVDGVLTITQASQTITALTTPVTKIYGDATYSIATTATSGLTVTYSSSDAAVASVATDGTVTIHTTGTATLTASQAGDSNYTAAGNVTQALTVNPKTLTITGLTANNKDYDGTTSATLSGTASLSGIVSGDEANVSLTGTPTATFDTSAVGNGKTVTVIGYSLNGVSPTYTYYTLAPLTLVANIVASTPTIFTSGTLSAVNTTYGTASSATSFSVSGQSLTEGILVSPPAGYEVSLSSGSGYASTVTVGGAGNVSSTTVYVRLAASTAVGSYSGNITLSSNGATSLTVATVSSSVSQKGLTISGLTGVDKTYDGSTTATVTGTATLNGVVGSDDVTLNNASVTYNFATATAGSNKPITVLGFSLNGTAAGNYSVSQPTGITATISKAASTISVTGSSSFTYNAAAQGPNTSSVTGSAGAITYSYNGVSPTVYGPSATRPTNAGSYTATSTVAADTNYETATSANFSFTIAKADQTITLASTDSKATGIAPYTLTANSSAGLAITYVSSVGAVATISGNTVTIVGAGTTTITATQAGDANYNAATTATQTLTVTQSAAPILAWNTFGNAGTETTEPSTINNNVASATLNYTGSSVTPGANTNRFGGSAWAVGALSTSNYIQFTVTPNAGYTFTPTSFDFIWDFSGTGPKSVALRSSADNYASNLGSLATMTASTSTVKTISISGLANISAATTFRLYGYDATATGGTGGFDTAANANNVVLNGFVNQLTTPTITLANATKTYGDAGFTMIASSNSGGAITYTSGTTGVATIDNSGNVTIIGFGSTVITASQAAVTGYAAGSATATLTVNKANGLTITANGVSKTYGATLSNGSSTAFSVSGLQYTDSLGTSPSVTLTYGTGGAAGDSATLSTVSPAVYTATAVPSALTAGSGATYNSNNYNAPSYVGGNITVNKANQSITFAATDSKVYGTSDYAPAATSASSGINALTYSTNGTSVTTIVSGNIHIVGIGTAVVTVAQAGDDNYNVATSVDQTLTVTAKGLTISGLSASNKNFDGNTNATVTGTPSLVGVVGSDDVSLSGTAVGTFVSSAVGTGIAVNVTGYSLNGTSAGNYTLTQPTLFADIIANTPTLFTSGTLTAVNTTYGSASATPSSFNVSAQSLTDVITVAAPAGFEVSLSSGSGYATSITLGGAGNVSSTPIYVRLAATSTVGTYSGDITLNSTGAAQVTIATASSIVAPKGLTISGLTGVDKTYDTTTTASVTGTATLNGIVGSDDVTLNSTSVTYNFASATAGSNKPITVLGFSLNGTAAGNYSVIQPTGLTATISKASSTISVTGSSSFTYNTTAQGPNTSSVTGSTGAITYSYNGVSPTVYGPSAISPTNAGSYTVAATVATDTNYEAATSANFSFTIAKADQTITLAATDTRAAGIAPYTLTANSSAGLTITYTSSVGAVATVSGNTVTIVAPGTTTITANQAGDTNYNAASEATQILTVTQPACASASGTTSYNFGASSPFTASPTTTQSNVTASAVTQGNSFGASTLLSLTSPSSGYTGASGTGNAGIAAVNGAFSLTTSAYFAFTVTPSAGYNFTLNGISFGSRSTSSAPQAYALRSSLDNYATDIATGTLSNNSTYALKTNTVSVTGNGNANPVTFRIYGYGGTSAAGSGTVNWRIDDLALAISTSNAPSTATVGSNQSVCGLTSAALGGNTPGVGTGSWSQVSGPGTSIFSSINSGASTATATVTGTYVYRWSINNGCATTNTADVTVEYKTAASASISAGGATTFCDGGSVTLTANEGSGYLWSNGATTQSINATATGNYTVTVTGANGCPATSAATSVTATPNTTNTTTITACDTYTWSVNGQTYTASGSYSSVSGCNTEVLNLTINTTVISEDVTASACDTYTWSFNGATYTASGDYTATVNCNTTTLHLTITPSTTHTTTVSACETYTWSAGNGQTYTTSGSYTHVTGCHTETLALTINHATSSSQSVTACDTYTWSANGQTYTTGGTYTAVGTNAAGCTDTKTLVLTINHSTSSSEAITACDSYTWEENGTTYTESGTYTSTSINAAGCPDTKTLNLTITPSSTNITEITACDSYTWPVTGLTYTDSDEFSVTVGCVTETLYLTINNSSAHTTTVTACDSYVWAAPLGNGTTYTESGTYTNTSTNESDCTHIETLELTITPSTSHTTTASACDTYTWTAGNGLTYTASGNYTYVNGCHVETLALTITPSTSNTTTLSVTGGSYTWSVNGQTYTSNGTYTSVSGCHTEILVLTLSGCTNTSSSQSATACGSYTWSVNGQTYTASGTYTSVSSIPGGCTDTKTLVLTITPAGTNTTTAEACDSYTWAVNGQTYTSSGNFSVTTGCNTEYLELTINNSTSNASSATACDSYVWNGPLGNGQTYTTSGTYTNVTTNAAGCDHTETLNLTINHTITTQPSAATVCATAGSTTSFTVVSSAASPTYSWQYRVITATAPNPNWITISATNASTVYTGYTSATLGVTRTSSLPAVGTQYRVLVGGGECGAAISDSANLTIFGITKAGAITAAASVCLNGDITFTVAGYVGTSFQWQSAPLSTGTFVNIPGANASTYTLVGATMASDKSYKVVVSNSYCGTSATSAAKTIKVNPTTLPGTVTGGGTLCVNGSGSLKLVGYVGTLQWEYSTDGITYVNAPKAAANQVTPFGTTSTSSTSATYLVNNISQDLYFRAKVTSGACSSAYSNVVQYIIGTSATAGTISVQTPVLCAGTGTTLTLTGAVGTITWYKSTNGGTTWTATTNHTATYATGNLSATTTYKADVTIGSCAPIVSTSPVAVTVNALAKGGTVTPFVGTSYEACSGVAKKLKVASYVGVIQWQSSADNITYSDISGANAATYDAVITTATWFRVKTTNGVCPNAAYSGGVQLTISAPAAGGTLSASANPICSGSGTSVTLAGASGTLVWQKSINYLAATPTWSAVTPTGNTLNVASLTASTAYRVTSTSGACVDYSNILIITVSAKPVAKAISSPVSSGTSATTALCTTDQSKVLNVAAGSVGAMQWQTVSSPTALTSVQLASASWQEIAGATSGSYTVTDPAAGVNYFRVRFSNGTCTDAYSAAFAVWYKSTCTARVDVASVKSTFNAVAYPNPYSENFNLSLTTSSQEKVGIVVYDMTGRLIERREVRTTDMEEQQIGDHYPSGVYNVVVTQGSDVKTLRVIKR